jgi:hypothetical protein
VSSIVGVGSLKTRALPHPVITTGIAHGDFCPGQRFSMEASAEANLLTIPAVRLWPAIMSIEGHSWRNSSPGLCPNWNLTGDCQLRSGVMWAERPNATVATQHKTKLLPRFRTATLLEENRRWSREHRPRQKPKRTIDCELQMRSKPASQ